MAQSLVWLASYPKSGNTWLRLVLASYLHPDIEEGPNQLVAGTIGDGSKAIFDHVGLDLGGKLPESSNEWWERRDEMLRLLANRQTDPQLLKSHFLNARFDGLELIPRDLTFAAIHVVRHPFDVCVSFAKHLGQSLEQTAKAMCSDECTLTLPEEMPTPLTSWSRHSTSWFAHSSNRRLTIRYEDMKLRPTMTFGNVLSVLGVRVDLARLESALQKTNFSKLKAHEQEQAFVEASKRNPHAFFNHGEIGRGATELPSHLQELLVKHCAPAMEQFGYTAEGTVI